MIPALLHGKLSRRQENMEDVLTSNVFGLLRYLPPEDGLFPFIALAESTERNNDTENNPLKRLLNNLESDSISISYEFWPRWNEPRCKPCEPDVVIHVEDHSEKLLICIEAKYLSGKSAEADESQEHPNDQLAAEWDNLSTIATRESPRPTPFLIYLTANIGPPYSEIKESIDDYRKNTQNPIKPSRILFLSWRSLSEVLKNSTSLIAKDLNCLIDRLGLTFFQGFTDIPQVPTLNWHFALPPFQWEKRFITEPLSWRFHHDSQ